MHPIAAGRCDTTHMHWTAAAIAESVGGVLRGPDVAIDTVTQDSRGITPERRCLFVPIVAARDGHDFIPQAVEAGAVAYLSARSAAADPVSAAGNGPPEGVATIAVADTAMALVALGCAGRDRLGAATVIGVTGSVGKTTTKDFLASVLATGLVTHAGTRSFNNEIGVPLTLLGAPDDAEAVVVEMGSRGIGDVAELCSIARPSIGVVTSVGTVHTSEFGDVESVARAKAELVEALPVGGLAVLNADMAPVAAMAERTRAEVVSFGITATADVRAERILVGEDLVPTFHLVTPAGTATVSLGARGVHLVGNALAAAAVGLHLGLGLDQVAAGLAAPALSPLRMELIRTDHGITIINDSYNANPMSTEAALRSLAALRADHRIAVLGVMAELGAESDREHARIAALATDLGIRVIAVDAPGYGGHDVAGIDQAVSALARTPAGTAILVKGSRVAGLERLVERLRSPTVDGPEPGD